METCSCCCDRAVSSPALEAVSKVVEWSKPHDSRGLLNQPGVVMWTPTTREHHIRQTGRYQTDMSDEEWRVIEPLLPPAGRPGGLGAGRCVRSSTASSSASLWRRVCCRPTSRPGGRSIAGLRRAATNSLREDQSRAGHGRPGTDRS